MKIVILYEKKNRTDWSVHAFKKEFENKGAHVKLFDINSQEHFQGFPPQRDRQFPKLRKLIEAGYVNWLNRIYPSNGNRENIKKALRIISWLNHRGCSTINPPIPCAADYNKFLAYRLMRKNNVPTPETLRIKKGKKLNFYLEKISLPCVIKRNTGGKSLGVIKINTKEKLIKVIGKGEVITGKYLIQKFASPVIGHDIRIVVFDGKAVASYGRTLVKNNDDKSWMGSCEHGSKIINYRAAEKEKEIAIAASQAIGAILNEVDMHITLDGPVIIENNPTPGCNKGGDWWITLVSRHISEYISRR